MKMTNNDEKQVAPYGSWKSPITSDLIVGGTIGLSQVVLDGRDTYWIEMRPKEGGRNCIVRRDVEGRINDMTPKDFSARTRVHEYGGGDYVVAEGTIYFSNFTDQRLYKQAADGEPRPLTPAVDMRYADAIIDRRRNRLIAVREDHTIGGGEPQNTIVSVRLDGEDNGGSVFVSGRNFFSPPRLGPDGRRLAWLELNHLSLHRTACDAPCKIEHRYVQAWQHRDSFHRYYLRARRAGSRQFSRRVANAVRFNRRIRLGHKRDKNLAPRKRSAN